MKIYSPTVNSRRKTVTSSTANGRADHFLTRSVFDRYIDTFVKFNRKRLMRQKLQKDTILTPRHRRRRRFLIMILSKFGLCVAISQLGGLEGSRNVRFYCM